IGGKLSLSIGDRSGSTYAGFPGFLDEVRLTSGVREFRAMSVVDQNRRHVFLRGEPAPRLSYQIFNHERTPLENVQATISAPSGEPIVFHLGQIAAGQSYELSWPFDTRLRPDQYDIPVRVTATTGDRNLVGEQVVQVTLVPRQSPHRMPVIMWGIGGLETAIKSFDKLKEIGFTHCLGLTCDYGTIWKAKKPTAPTTEEGMKSADVMLDAALTNDLGIIVGLSPGNWLDSQKQYRRIGRDGKQTRRENLANVSPEIEKYFFNVGASVANAWGNHPAVHAAMVDTEIRDGTSPSFHPQEQQAYRDFAGVEIPEEVASSRGVSWTKLKNFPASRIVPDNDPILKYYNWFWKNGDGWNTWHTALHRGFHSADAQRKSGPPLWTFFDPAVRAPSLYGSGGEVDFLSHWTYTYPDPIRIGLCTDELLTMAGGSNRSTPQSVMKMTQLIWYRSQTAPTQTKVENLDRSPWEDFDPDAAYITIAPMHLREALWMKLSRPIQGIMYHGWGSLVPGITSGYRYTHPETQHELSRLVKSVVEPLGPALRQIPAAPADVALLESFTSQMLAGRGTYGWGGSWGADCWHVLQYAHLQADIVYDETILQKGLDQYRVLALPDCDVLTESVAAAIHKFQQRGGIVIGDDRLAPGIKPDIRLTAWRRTRKAQEDQAKLIGMATELRKQLAGKYHPESDADQADVIVQRRRAGSSDYLFAINDRREYGQYVGQHGLVMEQGRPVAANVSIQRSAGHVYDLRRHREVSATRQGKSLQWPVTLAPADGALYLITQRPVEQLQVTALESISAGDTLELSIRVTDQANQPVDAVIPVQVQITDPEGRPAEFSGYHATVGGELKLPLDIASNDVRGIWTITVEEFATGQTIQQFVRVK
ncbi:MAG TPA: hypothetical protein VNQ76_09310, partial [Planctomicrobium sp.]|nr:hypothetical protein [Planctomicrobium sp.]